MELVVIVLSIFDDVKVDLVTDGGQGLVYDWIFPQYGHQVFGYCVSGIQYFEGLECIFRDFFLIPILTVIFNGPSDQVFHEAGHVLPVFLKEVKVKWSLDVGLLE